MKNILLVSPQCDYESLWVTGDETVEVRTNFPPMPLATIAALTPEDQFKVQIWDENVHGVIDEDTQFAEHYDLVGLTGFFVHMPRCVDIARIFRSRGILVAIGGTGVSSGPHVFRQEFDILFVNEAENTWPEFLKDWQSGSYKSEYRQIEKPDLDNSPVPKYDSIANDMRYYSQGSVQTTRGCPFDCDFCDVIFLFGRRPRHKTVERVIEEVQNMADFGLTTIWLTDDDFSGDRKYAKEVCRALIKLNASRSKPLTFSTHMTLITSRDDEFLELLADANFDLVFVGVETPSTEALLGANKAQNLKGGDIGDQVRKILSYGIAIRAGLIVGFDEDDRGIFEMQYQFVQDVCLPSFGINMLTAAPGTKLWQRLMKEKRVIDLEQYVKRTPGQGRSFTNIIPKQMTRVELFEGFGWLLKNAYSWDAFAERICGFISLVNRAPKWDAPITIEVDQLISQADGGPEAARAIRKIVHHTETVAPHLMKKAKTLVLQFAKYLGTVQRLLSQLDRQIQLEEQGKMKMKLDSRLFPKPDDFHSMFKEAFKPVYRRVYLNLEDKTKVPRALTDVFVDFLVRWGDDCETLEEHHLTLLLELCDRTCAAFNGTPPEEFIPFESDDAEVPNHRRLRLDDDVFKNVWMEVNDYHVTGTRHTDQPLHSFDQVESAAVAPLV